MTTSCTIDCKTASGKSLDELARLIALRSQRLNEMTSDATTAAAIDVLISLRASTRDARKHNVKPTVKARGDLCLSFRRVGAKNIPCLRTGGMYGQLVEGVFLRIDDAYKSVPAKSFHIFYVTPEHESLKPYYLATASAVTAKDYEKRRAARRISAKGGLARSALGIAMAKLSTRNVADDAGYKARVLASNLSHVTVTNGSGSFSIEYRDDLNYSIAALRGGSGAVDVAIQKAANKIAGMIIHAAHKAGDFEHDIETPFPDIKKRR